MATKFLEPGGDADFAVATTNGFWQGAASAVIATDFVHNTHQKSIRYAPSTANSVATAAGVLADAGSRISVYVYFVALPGADAAFLTVLDSGSSKIFSVNITSGGVLRFFNEGTGSPMGSTGATLSTGIWYRISVAYTITSASVNEFRLFKNGVQTISVSNATSMGTGSSMLRLINGNGDASMDFRSSDHYVDDSSALTDTGDVNVTAKRPNANGTTNGFTTQVGAGGSGYGSGHSPQVNERPLSNTNGWSMIGAGSAVTEEYTIEGASTGDIDISGKTIVDYMGWVSTKSLVGETINIIVGGSNFSQAITSTNTLYLKAAGSSTYPTGGTGIGIITDTSLTTVTLNECGVVIAYLGANNFTSTLSETITLSNVLSKSITLRNFTESFSLSDVITTLKTKTLALVESFSLSNVLKILLNGTSTIWANLTKSSAPSWGNQNKSSTPSWGNQNKSSNPTWTNQDKN